MTAVRRPFAGGAASAGRWAAAAAAVVLALAACGGKPTGPAAGPPRSVQLLTVGTMGLPRTVDVTGVLAAQEELVLGFQVPGRLQRLAVDVGDALTGGQELAALDERDFALQLERARTAVAAARARLGLPADGDLQAVDLEATAPVREARAVLADAELKRQRTAAVVKEEVRSQAELDAAEAAVAVANSRLQRARDDVHTWVAEARQRQVELELAQKAATDARLLAPWPGRVQQRHATAGQVLAVGAPVLTLVRVDPLRLRLQVPERVAVEIAVGQTVAFTVDGELPPAPGAAATGHTGRIVRLGAGIDRTLRTLLAEAAVDNADGRLRVGGFCRARILVAADEAAVVVPRAALLSFAGVDRVFTVVDGRLQELLVTPGRVAGDRVEIVRGLQPGQAIVADARGLLGGMTVVVGS